MLRVTFQRLAGRIIVTRLSLTLPEPAVPAITRCLLLTIATSLAIAAFTLAQPPTGPAEAGKTKGLDDALRNLHAPLAGGEPLSPAESLKKLKV